MMWQCLSKYSLVDTYGWLSHYSCILKESPNALSFTIIFLLELIPLKCKDGATVKRVIRISAVKYIIYR